jgi:hypothetical protein
MALLGNVVEVPAAATSLATLLALPADFSRKCRQLTLRLASTATGPLYVGATSGVTTVPANAYAVLLATDTYPTIFGGQDNVLVDLSNVYVIGTASANDILYVAYVS